MSISHEAGVGQGLSGLVMRFNKKQPAAESGITFSLIKRVYRDAIEYTGIPQGTRGVLLLMAWLLAVFCFWGAWYLISDTFRSDRLLFADFVGLLFAALICSFGAYLGIRYARIELFRPMDEPVIFDRRYRKVYRIYREVYPGWRGLFRVWPTKVVQYDWDFVEAEHHAILNANTSTISRNHALVFSVRANAEGADVIESFTIGSGLQMGETTVPAVWEHIRRFMEENGPHLGRGEEVTSFDRSKNFFAYMREFMPYGGNFKVWWTHQRVLAIILIVFLPVVLPLLFLAGVFSWLSYVSATPVSWPREVLLALGEPVAPDRRIL